MCTKNQNLLHNRADEVQNQINAIRDCLQVIEGNLLDFVDNYYSPQIENLRR